MNALELQHCTKRFGATAAVSELSLTVPFGEFCGLIGHNGAGKSTTLRLITGLLAPTEGTVQILGLNPIENPAESKKEVGIVPEDPPLYEYLSAIEFFEFIAEVRGKGDVATALEISDLGTAANRAIREYSQGMKKKTAIAAALLGDPKLIILDESLNGLDPPSSWRIHKLLRQRVDQGATVLLSSHAIEALSRIADRLVVLREGQLIDDLPAQRWIPEDIERWFLRSNER